MKFTIAVFCSLLLPFLVLVSYTGTNIRKIEEQNARQYMSANLNTVSSSIDEILQNVDNFYAPLLINKEFCRTVRTLQPYDSRDPYQDFLDTNCIRDALLETASTNNYIYSIYAYSYPAGRVFSSKINWNTDFNHYDRTQSPWLSAYEDGQIQNKWILTTSIEDSRPILTSYRTIKQNKKLYGLLSINIDASVISQQLKNVLPDEDSFCFMTDPEFHIITSMEKEGNDQSIYQTALKEASQFQDDNFLITNIDGQKMFILSYLSKNTGFRYYIFAPYRTISTIASMVSTLLKQDFFVILVLTLLLILLAVIIFFRPIRQLVNGMASLRNGDFDTRLPNDSSYEINYINQQFNRMTDNIQKLITENYEQQLLRKDAEIRTIQLQLNEHFLYNTLDTIRWKARMEDAPMTSNMVYSLASFYRIYLSSGQHFISVENIVEMLRSYLTLQQIRRQDTVTWTLECDPELYPVQILKYLFQPVLENCFSHGMDGLDRPMHIKICFNKENGCFHFSVTDNGVGISPEKLNGIYQNLDMDIDNKNEHFALNLIHRQLQKEYHLEKTLYISSEPGKFCTVEFFIPMEQLQEAIL